MKSIFKILPVMLFIMVTFSGCGLLIGAPMSEKAAINNINDGFGYEVTYLGKDKVKSEYKPLRNDTYYEFEDSHGIKFSFVSEVEPFSIDGATLFYVYGKNSYYQYCVIPFYADKMKAICQNNGLVFHESYPDMINPRYDLFGNKHQFTGCGVEIAGYSDLDAASDAIYQMLDECRISDVNTKKYSVELAQMHIAVGTIEEKGFRAVHYFRLCSDNADIPDKNEIYTTLKKEYIEKIKSGIIANNDLPEGLLENVCPEIIRGRYNDEFYQQWTAHLIDDSEIDNPSYDVTLKYREYDRKEPYTYVDCYNNRDLSIYNILAQLGADVTYSKNESDIGVYQAILGDDVYHIYFENDNKSTVVIELNGDVHIYETELDNPANNSRRFDISMDEFSDLFGVNITLDKKASEFIVERN